MYNWENKVVVITGSSSGIGGELANQLAMLGAKIVLNARNKERLILKENDLKEKGYSVFAVAGDISNFEDCLEIIKETIDQYGKVDVLINNAGLSVENCSFETISTDVFKKIIDVNVIGAINMTKASLEYIKLTKGSIIYISSLAGLQGLGNYSAYCTSKMALSAIAESLYFEMKKHLVHIGIAYVGFTQNSTDKLILDFKGNAVPHKPRNNIHPSSVKVVAKNIIQMIEKKKFKTIFTKTGLILSLLKRVSPKLLNYILLKIYIKEESEKTGNVIRF